MDSEAWERFVPESSLLEKNSRAMCCFDRRRKKRQGAALVIPLHRRNKARHCAHSRRTSKAHVLFPRLLCPCKLLSRTVVQSVPKSVVPSACCHCHWLQLLLPEQLLQALRKCPPYCPCRHRNQPKDSEVFHCQCQFLRPKPPLPPDSSCNLYACIPMPCRHTPFLSCLIFFCKTTLFSRNIQTKEKNSILTKL